MPSASSTPVVVITGASAGVGRATAREFARRGAALGLLARGQAGLDGARDDAERLGAARVVAVPTDVGRADQVDAAARSVEQQLGPPDVWVNNAMASVFAKVVDVTAEEFRRVTEVTYLGAVHGTLAALERMRPRNAGTIVQVGSALASRGIPLQAAYCAAKHAMVGLHDSLRAELLAEGSSVRLSMVHLPAINTPQFTWVRTRLPRHPQPVPPIYQPEVAARAIVWAAEHAPRVLNVGSPTLATRWANKLAPGLLDRYLARNAVDDQQTDETVDLGAWRDNLDAPADQEQDRGAHGPFGDQARDRSPQLWAVTHRGHLAAGAAAAAAALRALARPRG